MKLHAIFIGKTTGKHFPELVSEYAERLGHYIPFTLDELPELKNTKALTEEQQKAREAQMVIDKLQPGDVLVLLDERGKQLSSMELSRWMEQKMHTVSKRLVLLIGGPYGFDQKIYDLASEKLSLSRMTFSHQMVRVFLVEQLYRAMTIIKGESYHHE